MLRAIDGRRIIEIGQTKAGRLIPVYELDLDKARAKVVNQRPVADIDFEAAQIAWREDKPLFRAGGYLYRWRLLSQSTP
jgi:hypothetical protein